jgi:acyl-CoA synthetase (AMP-forming)/AMP-acid ligase II
MKELVFTRSLLPSLQRNADRIGFIDAATGRSVTFGEHLDRISRLSHAMSAELAVGPRDRVAVIGLNSLPFVELWHSCLLGAAVMNPLNLRFSADELTYVLNDSGTQVCFVDATFAPLIAAIRDRTGLKRVVLMGEAQGPADASYEDLLAAAEPQLSDEPDEESEAVLMYTGGTTGLPKGVVLSHRAEVLNQYHAAMALPALDGGFLVQTPLFHGASMIGLFGPAMFGKPSMVLPAFTPEASLVATETFRPSTTVLVPTMLGMIVNSPEFRSERLASLRRITYGASPMPEALLSRLLQLLPECEIVQGYGMTECCTVLTVLSDADHRQGQRLGSCGRAVPGVQLEIRDDAGNPLPVGEPGEVCARAGNFMTGYLNKAAETALALRDGWYHTGDVGYLDAAGYLFLVDRAKDMIISGGENIYSVEVENAICTHPAVLQVAVIGIPDEVWGEAVHAVCVVRPGHEVTAEQIVAHARTTIAGYKVPRSIELRGEPLPLSAAMKVLKRELRAPFWAGQDRTIN